MYKCSTFICKRFHTFYKHFSAKFILLKRTTIPRLFSIDNCHYEKIGSEVKNIDDEIDFDLPDGWEYIRLSQIAYLGSGFTPSPSELSTNGNIPYFKVSDMNTIGNEKYISITQQYYIGDKTKKVFPKHTIIFPKNGGAVFTNKKRILSQDSIVDLNTGAFIPYGLIDVEYAYILFSTIDFREHYKGTALPTINTEFMDKLIFGLPPIAEQKRIVKAIEKLSPYIQEYDNLEQQATKLDNEIYDKLKKSILQYAIQGKLVEQNENDEPASVLLERIRAEKKAQLGKKYVESYIYKGDDNCYYEHIGGKDVNITEEIPHDLPSGWAWTRMGTIADVKGGKRIPAGRQLINDNNGHVYIRVTDMKDGSVTLDSLKYVPLDVVPIIKNYIISKDDLYLTIAGTIGKVGIIPDELDGMNLTENAVKLCNIKVDKHFLMKTIETTYVQSLFNEKTNKVAQPKLAIERILSCLIPVPPLAEQKRIVDKINEIFAKL